MNHPQMLRSALAVSLLGSVAVAQGGDPRLRASAAASLVPVPASVVTFDVVGGAGRPFAVLVDGGSGPSNLLGQTVRLDLSASLSVALIGALPPSGFVRQSLAVPADPALADLTIYSQGFVIDPAAPNGAFRITNGESTVLHATPTALVERFDDPAAAGWTGSFDPSSQDTLRGVLERRTVRPVDGTRPLDPLAFPVAFGQPIASPFDPRGNRTQFVYRARELGATGAEEVLTDIRWRPFPSAPVTFDRLSNVEVRLSHSTVVPDYTINAVTALPVSPRSGLGSVFSSNPSSPEVLVRTGSYTIDPNRLTPNRFLSYGVSNAFAYNGVDSLLIDVRTFPSPGASGLNGSLVYLPVQSSPNPVSRVVAAPPFGSQTPIDPNAVTFGNGDNAIHDIEIDFARVVARATSPFRFAGLPSPDYLTPTLATYTPGQSRITIEFRGADDATGSNATPWAPNVDIADGRPFLQYRVELVSDPATDAVPELDTLVVPLR